MVGIEFISKSLDDAIIKCHATDNAKKIGASCTITTEKGDSIFDTKHIYTYGDGTSLTFDDDYNLINIGFEGIDYPYYLHRRAYEEFEYQKKSLMTTVDGEEPDEFQKSIGIVSDWEYLLEYADDFASVHGFIINNEMRDGKDIDSEDYYNSWLEDTDALLNHDWFVKIENKTLADHDNYCAMRVTRNIHDNENLSKRIVQDKAHSCASVGADTESLLRTFGNGVMENIGSYGLSEVTEDNFHDSWKTITLVKKDSGVHALFLGTALNEGRHCDAQVGTLKDWEKELNFPPKTKFERLIIDEEHKIIIQTPKVE